MSKIPLGQATEYPQEYAPDVLFSVSRDDARRAIGLGRHLPFHGQDIWNAWELTWLDTRGQPLVGTAALFIPASSPSIVESKSLKLYLGSFAMTRFETTAELVKTIARDVGQSVGAAVEVAVQQGANAHLGEIGTFPGDCVDELPMSHWPGQVAPGLLSCSDEIATATLHSHLLRSLCPVTGQPDLGSVMIHYRGPRIEPASFLDYVVSFRQHQDFHEACVERIFLDLKERCRPHELTVYARYNRRGGIDINPFRSDFEDEARNIRLWRQ